MQTALLLASLLATAAAVCSQAESCVAVRSCPSVVKLLTSAKEAPDVLERARIVLQVREAVCGAREDRTVCCPSSAASNNQQQHSEPGLNKIGDFVDIWHDIGGRAYAVDAQTVLIKGFTYDGEGPDTFFLAGTGGRPSAAGDLVLPWPADGKQYQYSDRDIPLITRSFDGSEDLTLTLPPGTTVDQLK